tara:strand:+ start:9824 stop:10114 length:291 start_codon:yes stop_codon:yes gene_type:complete
MNNFCSCFYNVVSPTLNSIYKTLPSSPEWNKHHYTNQDCQPDEEFSEEKRIDFHKDLLKLINYPNETYYIKKFDNHPDGPIKSYLQGLVIYKRSKL